jgi:hypothetical protein
MNMKITYTKKKPSEFTFGDIKAGDAFKYLHLILIKTHETNTEKLNAFCPVNNYLYTMSDNSLVTPINLEVIIEGEEA